MLVHQNHVLASTKLQFAVYLSSDILPLQLTYTKILSPLHKAMVAVVRKAASYTLGISISHKHEKVYDDSQEETHTRLIIRLPSNDFADLLERKLRNVKNTDDRLVFSGETVTLHRCDVSIILPLCVKKIEVDPDGAILVFDKAENAKAWKHYPEIWSKRPKSGPKKTRLRISYNWAHSELEKAVRDPS